MAIAPPRPGPFAACPRRQLWVLSLGPAPAHIGSAPSLEALLPPLAAPEALGEPYAHGSTRRDAAPVSAARGCLSGGVSRYFLPASSSRSFGVKAALSRA